MKIVHAHSLFDEKIDNCIFDAPPKLEKALTCPTASPGTIKPTVYLPISEWVDFTQRQMANNMRPTHAMTAAHARIAPTGRYYFRVEVNIKTDIRYLLR